MSIFILNDWILNLKNDDFIDITKNGEVIRIEKDRGVVYEYLLSSLGYGSEVKNINELFKGAEKIEYKNKVLIFKN